MCLLYNGLFLLPSSGRSFHIYETWCLANTRREIPAPTPHDEADWTVNFQFKQSKARNFLINREVSGFLFAMISSGFHAIRLFYAKWCYDLCSAKRALFRFGSRNGCVVGGCRPAKGRTRKLLQNSSLKKICTKPGTFSGPKRLKKGSGFLFLHDFFAQVAIAFLFCNSSAWLISEFYRNFQK